LSFYVLIHASVAAVRNGSSVVVFFLSCEQRFPYPTVSDPLPSALFIAGVTNYSLVAWISHVSLEIAFA
jgi:hypothetical protein